MKRIVLSVILVALVAIFFIFTKSAIRDLAHCFGNNIQPTNTSEQIPDTQTLFSTLVAITPENISKIAAINAHDNNTNTIYGVFNSAGRILITGNSKIFRVLNLFNQTEEITKIDDKSVVIRGVFDAEFTPIMLNTAVGSRKDGEIIFRLINGKTKQDIVALPLTDRETINDVKFTPNNECVALASSYSKIRIWNILTKTEHTLIARNEVTSIDYSADGKLLTYGTYGDNDSSGEVSVVILDLEHDKEVAIFKGHATTITKVLFSHDGKVIASSSWDKTIRLWDVETGKALATLKGHTDGVTDFTFSSDDKLIASVSRDNTIRLWDTTTDKQIKVLDTQSPLFRISFTTNMQLLISLANDGKVVYWGVNLNNK